MHRLYAKHKYPCLDKYPGKTEFITNDQILNFTRQQLKQQYQKGLLKGKLSMTQTNQAFKKLKAAFKVASIWDPINYPDLRIHFLDGSEKQKNWVKLMVNRELVPLCDKLNFKWDSPIENSHIRISFKLPGQAWSTVGTDSLLVHLNEATMNLGWLDDDTQYGAEEYKNSGQVVLHEFCHALGMIHEHQNSKDNPIVWNKDVVYQELRRTNGWNKEQIDHNMFEKYGDYELCKSLSDNPNDPEKKLKIKNYCQGELINGSKYDKYSIMHYFYPASWILEGPSEIPVNLVLSDLDKKWLKHYYGKGGGEGNNGSKEGNGGSKEGNGGSKGGNGGSKGGNGKGKNGKNKLNNTYLIILICIITLYIILYYIILNY